MSSVLILAGGNSTEREISLRSGSAVAAALRESAYQVTTSDPANGLDTKLVKQADVVFPLLHGAGGEDGLLQAELDKLRVPYVGSGEAASRSCFDKWHYKNVLREHNLPVPAGEVIDRAPIKEHPLAQRPFVCKPCNGGSSVDTFIVRDITKAPWSDIENALHRHGTMLLEELVDGIEITVGVVGNKPLPVIEIIPPSDQEFDYANKYNGLSQELCPPEHLNIAIEKQAQDLAWSVHKLCGCRDYSRSDMMVTKSGELKILETNTIPGMTDQSLLPKAAAEAGLSMPQLVDALVKLALSR